MIEDILEIPDKRIKGTFILRKSIEINLSYNIYKTSRYKLYVQLTTKLPYKVLEYEDTLNISSTELEKGWRIVDKGFLEKLLDWILDDRLNKFYEL